jgi:hypothetical protein
MTKMKKCPYCAEDIQDDAVVCRFCGRNLSTSQINQTSYKAQPQPLSQQNQLKKRNWIIAILAMIGFLSLVCVCLCVIIYTGLLDTSSSTASTYSVTYKVTGTASRVSLTYENAQGGTEQTSARIPWDKSFTTGRGNFLYISAQNKGEIGSVTCQIWVDGVKWRESTSYGAYAITTCSGRAGED